MFSAVSFLFSNQITRCDRNNEQSKAPERCLSSWFEVVTVGNSHRLETQHGRVKLKAIKNIFIVSIELIQFG